jgi:hypothetical protein
MEKINYEPTENAPAKGVVTMTLRESLDALRREQAAPYLRGVEAVREELTKLGMNPSQISDRGAFIVKVSQENGLPMGYIAHGLEQYSPGR